MSSAANASSSSDAEPPLKFVSSSDYNASNQQLVYGLNLAKPDSDSDSDDEQARSGVAALESESNDAASNANAMQPPPVPDNSALVITDKYATPFWNPEAAVHHWSLMVIKDGVELPSIALHHKGYLLVGRTPECDISLLHPSMSRQHAVFQHRKNGDLYVYDLDSTHGTFVNKARIKPRVYTVLKTGDCLKFGASTRLFFLTGGPEPPVTTPKANAGKSRAPTPAPSETEQRPAAESDGSVFTGNELDFKQYLEAQKRKAHRKQKNTISAAVAGFDMSDYKKQRRRDVDRLDFEEKRTFTTSSRSRRAVGGLAVSDDDEPDGAGLDDDDDEVDEAAFSDSDDPLASRRHLGSEMDVRGDRFDDSDDFYDRTAQNKSKKRPAPTKAAKKRASAALSYEQLVARRDGLAVEANRVRDELQWYEVNVLDAAAAAAAASDGGDSLEQYEQQVKRNEQTKVAATMKALATQISAAQEANERLVRIAAPAQVETQRDIEARVRRECLWWKDSVVLEFVALVDHAFLPIQRRRPRRPMPQSVARPEIGDADRREIDLSALEAEERALATEPPPLAPQAVAAAAVAPIAETLRAGLNPGKKVDKVQPAAASPTKASSSTEPLPQSSSATETPPSSAQPPHDSSRKRTRHNDDGERNVKARVLGPSRDELETPVVAENSDMPGARRQPAVKSAPPRQASSAPKYDDEVTDGFAEWIPPPQEEDEKLKALRNKLGY